MKEHLARLVQLQEIDLKLAHYREEERVFPERLRAAQGPLEGAKEALLKSKEAESLLVKERREKEQSLQMAEERITKLKSRLTELKTNKEYQAHLHEIESATAEKGKIEEQLLTIMERIDSLKGESAVIQKMLTQEEEKFRLVKEAMENGLKALSESMKDVEKEGKFLSESVEKGLLGEYKRLAARHKGVSVVPLKGNICTGCHFSLPPQLVAEVKMGEKVTSCSYCHRILYFIPNPPAS
ncbi:MAG: C4-type zinc ribbon domain-containing protein [Candidatus Manganitrophaceae bacterium]